MKNILKDKYYMSVITFIIFISVVITSIAYPVFFHSENMRSKYMIIVPFLVILGSIIVILNGIFNKDEDSILVGIRTGLVFAVTIPLMYIYKSADLLYVKGNAPAIILNFLEPIMMIVMIDILYKKKALYREWWFIALAFSYGAVITISENIVNISMVSTVLPVIINIVIIVLSIKNIKEGTYRFLSIVSLAYACIDLSLSLIPPSVTNIMTIDILINYFWNKTFYCYLALVNVCGIKLNYSKKS